MPSRNRLWLAWLCVCCVGTVWLMTLQPSAGDALRSPAALRSQFLGSLSHGAAAGEGASPSVSVSAPAIVAAPISVPVSGRLPEWLEAALPPDLPLALVESIRGNAPGWWQVPAPPTGPGSGKPSALLYLGWLAYNPVMGGAALSGGPSGEFVYWADLVAGLVALGCNVSVVHSAEAFWREVTGRGGGPGLVITDYDGLGTAEGAGHFPREHCKYFIVDGFGTQPEFNAGRRQLDLSRVLTPYPFDGSNTAVNMMVSTEPPSAWQPRARIGLLWGKSAGYLRREHLTVLKRLSRVLPMHSFLSSLPSDYHDILINHNVVSRVEFVGYLQRARFIIGVGLPLDGPTALQAIAHGCAFINPVLSPPVVLRDKPNRRRYTSQHPFVEEYIGPPYAYTVDILDWPALSGAVSTILDADPAPFVHPVHSPAGYMQNLRRVLDSRGRCDREHPPVGLPGNQAFDSFEEFQRSNK